MRVGIISPVKYLGKFSSKLHLCYASLLHKKEYLDFYNSIDGLRILEDSPELPREPNVEKLKTGIKLLEPDYVVLPSIDYSAVKTIKLAKYFLRRLSTDNIIGVVQGYDLDSLQVCYNFLKDNCSLVALPSPLETIARRSEIARDLGLNEKVIWLEVYKDPYEEVPPKDSIGICTSFPLRMAQVNKRLSEFTEKPSNPLLLDFDKEDLVLELASENVRAYIGAVQG